MVLIPNNSCLEKYITVTNQLNKILKERGKQTQRIPKLYNVEMNKQIYVDGSLTAMLSHHFYLFSGILFSILIKIFVSFVLPRNKIIAESQCIELLICNI